MVQRSLIYCLKVGMLCAFYFATAKLGLALNAVSGFATLVWPPTGIALAAIFLFGYNLWPGILLAAFAINVVVGASPWVALGIGIGNTLEAVIGVYLMRRCDFRPTLERLRDVVALIFLAAIVSPVISSTIGVASLYLGGQLHTSALDSTLGAWWLGDAIGGLLVAPFLMIWSNYRWRKPDLRTGMEITGLATILVFLSVATFGSTLAALLHTPFVPRYFIFPFLIWPALRFGARGGLTATFLVATIAVWETTAGHGAPIGTTQLENLLYTQSFVCVVAVTTMVLAAIVADRQKARTALEDSEKKLRSVLDHVADGIVTIDDSFHIVSWNLAAQRMFGYATEEVVGKDVKILAPELRQDKTPSLNGNKEIIGLRKSGSTFPLDLAVSEFRLGGQLFYTGILRDITERKRNEAELFAAKEAADAASRAKSSFLANMSHEIRTPLGAVLGFSDLLVTGNKTLSTSEMSTYAAAIRRNGDLLSGIINDILDLSKVEAGKLEIDCRATELTDILSDISAMLHLQAKDKGLQLSINSVGVVPEVIYTDGLRLRQILINIVGNAIKFTKKGTIEVRIEHTCGTGVLSFQVTDTGPGIEPSTITRLFEPFTQADVSTSRRFGGTGLGLVLSKRLANLLGGDVVLTRSTLGQGSTFTVRIQSGVTSQNKSLAPLANRLPDPPLAPMPKEIRLDGVKILLADDAPDNQVLISRLLRSAGANVDMANDGSEAIDKVRTKDYDVLLMDLQMPRLDGYQTTSALRRSGFCRPIIALTAHVLNEERQRCLASGFDDHLGKPVNRQRLLESIFAHNSRGKNDATSH